jgi:hypothetical protein
MQKTQKTCALQAGTQSGATPQNHMVSIEHTKTPTASDPTDGESTSPVIETSEGMKTGQAEPPISAVRQENEPSRAATLLGSETNPIIKNEIATRKLRPQPPSGNPESIGSSSAQTAFDTVVPYSAPLLSAPVHEAPKEVDSADEAVDAARTSAPIPSRPELHREQSPQPRTSWETSPPNGKRTPAFNRAPVTFQTFPPCPAPGEGCNAWCLSAAYACKRYGLSPEESTALIRTQISRVPRGDEIERAVKKAYGTNSIETVQRSITATYNEAELRSLAYNAPNWSVEDLKVASPIDVRNCTTIQYLRHIFRRRERVLLATSMDDPGTIWLNDPADPNSREDELDSFKLPSQGQGAWFLSNPVTGEFVTLERLKTSAKPSGESLRSRENLTSFRYLLLESDKAPPDLWISALVQLPLPIVSIVASGGKSLHALVRIDAAHFDQWNAIKQRIAPALVTLGADKGALTDVRLTRLPGSYRAEKTRWQELLYLNPNADETPICQLRRGASVSKQH